MRLAHASLTGLGLSAVLALGLGFAACTDADTDDYPVVPGASNAVGGAGPGQTTDPGGDDGFPVDGGTLGPDGTGSLDGGTGGTPDGTGSFDGGTAPLDGDFTPVVDAA